MQNEKEKMKQWEGTELEKIALWETHLVE